jgi:hypothetical protein
MPLKAEVLDRLLLSKSFLERIRYQPVASHDRHTLASNIIAAQDSAELAVAAICDQLGCLPQNRNSYLMDYFDSFKNARNAELHGREYFRNLNATRSLLKHQGLFPDSRQWARVGGTVFQYITRWCSDNLGESFAELDESALLLNADVKRLYDKAKGGAQQKDYKTALEDLALALSIVFAENAALRGFEAGNSSAEDGIRVLGFGIHGNDFLALQEFLPHVPSWGADVNTLKWKQSHFGHPGNWHEHSVSFCLQTFVDVAVKLQGAQWIPGAISREILYDQQIEVLGDEVEFWRFVPDGDIKDVLDAFTMLGGKVKREAKQLLPRKGDKLRAIVRQATLSLSTGARFADSKDKTTLSLFLPETFESWCVRASDVKVTCIPKEAQFVAQRFGWLPEVDWEPE